MTINYVMVNTDYFYTIFSCGIERELAKCKFNEIYLQLKLMMGITLHGMFTFLTVLIRDPPLHQKLILA